MKRPHRQRKWFGEHLGPLRRWLRSTVGRKWNDVYGEACCVIKANNAVRVHIRTHMMDYVQRHTFLRDGEVWCWQFSKPLPVGTLRGHPVWPTFFVHPETGLLHEVPHAKKAILGREADQNRANKVRRWISDRLLLLKIEGLWFACEMEPLRKHSGPAAFDIVFKLRLAESHARDAYGRSVYCRRKRQLSRRGLRKYELQTSLKCDGIHALLGQDLLERMKRSNGNPRRGRLQDRVSVLKPATCRVISGKKSFFDGSQDWVIACNARSPVRVRPPAPDAGVAQW